jgi:hypothetical protein
VDLGVEIILGLFFLTGGFTSLVDDFLDQRPTQHQEIPRFLQR